MAIKTTHRDHEIEFDEATGIWSCGSMGLSDKDLPKLRKAIDRESKKMRSMAVRAIYMVEPWNSEVPMIQSCTITLILENGRNARVKFTGSGGRGEVKKGGTDQVAVSSLYRVEHLPLLERYAAAKKEQAAAEKIASDIWEEVHGKVLDAAQIRELVVQQTDEAT